MRQSEQPLLSSHTLPMTIAASPVSPRVVSLVHKAFWDSWTIQGICSSVHWGPCHMERRTFITTLESPIRPLPSTYSALLLPCLYITLPSASVHHPRPDVIPLSPFFIMRKNRTNLATESSVSHTKCFWRSTRDWRENSAFWDVMVCWAEKGGFGWRKSSCTFPGT